MPQISIETINGKKCTIPLTRGLEAIVDADDYDWVSQWRWYASPGKNTFYAVRMTVVDGKRRTLWMHREIIKTPDGLDTDHINRNGLDNRRKNLRAVPASVNQFNKTPSRAITGVHFHKRDKAWTAIITRHGKSIHLGTFASQAEALAARKKAESIYYPEIAHATMNGERCEIAIDGGDDA